MTEPTLPQVVATMSILIDKWTTFMAQLRNWQGGLAEGGPNGDGKYPLSDYGGETSLIECPAKQAARVNGTVGSAAIYAAAADLSAATADSLRIAAEAAKTLAEAARDDAQAARDLALIYSNTAGTHASNAALFDPDNFYTKAEADARFAPI